MVEKDVESYVRDEADKKDVIWSELRMMVQDRGSWNTKRKSGVFCMSRRGTQR